MHPKAVTGAAGWMEGKNISRPGPASWKAHPVTTAAIPNEVPPEQSCPAELVQLGPFASGWIEDVFT